MNCECGREVDSGAMVMALERKVGLRCKQCAKIIPHAALLKAAANPRRRREHPLTSELAARAKVPHLREAQDRALAYVADHPGRTSKELARIAGDDDSRTIGRRLPELERKGLIERGGSRHCAITGRLATTWVPVGVRIDDAG